MAGCDLTKQGFANSLKETICEQQRRMLELVQQSRGGKQDNTNRIKELRENINGLRQMLREECGQNVAGENISFEFDTQAIT